MAAETQPPLSPSNWLEQHGNALYRYALTMVKNPSTAEELVQETFVAGLESLQNYRGQSNPRGWLFGILRHKIHDHFRRLVRDRKREIPINEEAERGLFDADGTWLNPPAALPRDPHEILQEQQFRSILKGCLDGLPAAQRSVLLMRAFEEMATEEICKELGISTTYLWVLVHRARNGTRKCLEESWIRKSGN